MLCCAVVYWRWREGEASLRFESFVVVLPFPAVRSYPFLGVSIVPTSGILFGVRQAQHSKHRCCGRHHIISSSLSPLPFVHTTYTPSRRFQNFSLSSSCIQYAVYHSAGCPLGSFPPPSWLDQSWPSMRLSMTPQRLGKTQISTGLVSRYDIPVPPMAADQCFITSPRHAL